MPQKRISKYCSLKYLIALTETDFCNRESNTEYAPEEVLTLLYEKLNKKSKEDSRKLIAKHAQAELEKMREYGFKYCSKCKKDKIFLEFHPDKSKKFFGLRSHCRECRKTQIPF